MKYKVEYYRELHKKVCKYVKTWQKGKNWDSFLENRKGNIDILVIEPSKSLPVMVASVSAKSIRPAKVLLGLNSNVPNFDDTETLFYIVAITRKQNISAISALRIKHFLQFLLILCKTNYDFEIRESFNPLELSVGISIQSGDQLPQPEP